MAFPTSEQVMQLGIKPGVVCVNEGRNRWPRGAECKVLELNEVGSVKVCSTVSGEVTYLLASDLYPKE